jgi:death-on-curing protein
MRYLTLEEVLVLHAYQINTFGGNSGIRDTMLLESAVARPQTSLSGKEMFPTVFHKAAVLASCIIQNHPFIDGNKRTGIHAMLVFLELNNARSVIDDGGLIKLGKGIATKLVNLDDVVKILKNTSQHLPK